MEDLELASSVAKEGSVFRQVPMRTDIQIDPSGEAKPVQQKAHSVTIIARKRYLSIFRKIDTINEASRKLYGKDIIIVNILTNATYEQKEIHAIFSAAFPGCETIKKGVFYNNKRKQDPNKPSYPLPKHLQMQEDFDNVFEKIGALKVLTFLLDDSRTNCLGATKQGFQFLHFPINPMGRRPLQSYTNGEGKLFFEGIETLIHELAKHHEIDISS